MSEQAIRTGGPIHIRGQFTSCRHHSTTDPTAKTFRCNKYGTIQTNCDGCPTCPKCDGPLFTNWLVKTRGRDRMYAEHSKSCILCGVYIEETLQAPLHGHEHKPTGTCQVQGCRNTHEKATHTEEVEGSPQTFRICEVHRQRLKTWRNHPTKGPEHKPILVVDGALVENPHYRITTSKESRERDPEALRQHREQRAAYSRDYRLKKRQQTQEKA